ncbi:MAG TPA: hypothetical protein VGI58_19410 [Streptosporangiaceae bacterium]
MNADISDLVALVYRTDWQQVSLSARISQTFDIRVARRLAERKAAELGKALGPWQGAWRLPRIDVEDRGPVQSERSVLTARGGRYRVQQGDASVVVCDGEQRWHISGGEAHRGLGRVPGRDFCGLLTPQWLVACYDLQVTGSAVADGRPAIQVTGTPRAASAKRRGAYQLLDRVEVLVDAELGVLLRSRQIFEGQTRESAELRDLVIDPPEAGTAGLFAPPPDVPHAADEEPFADYHPPDGIGWQVAGAAASAAATAVGFAIRHAPRRKLVWPTEDEEPDMPADAVLAPEDWKHHQPPDGRIVNLLHGTNRVGPALTAEVHEWVDVRPLMQKLKMIQDKMPAPLEGVFGPDAVWDAFAERAAEDGGGHRVARLAVEFPGHYRLDYLSGDWNKPYKAMACDGEHTTKLFDDRVATGPVKRLDANLASVLDPAWLLSGWKLAVIGPARVAGRDGIVIRAVETATADNGADDLFAQADLVIDTELGVLLRLTTYVNDQPANRTELRKLRPLDDHTSFRIVAGPGIRSVADSGGPLADRNLPRPAEAVATAATVAAVGALAGAAAVTGWLDKHRARRDRR